jgi:hypothetical protein
VDDSHHHGPQRSETAVPLADTMSMLLMTSQSRSTPTEGVVVTIIVFSPQGAMSRAVPAQPRNTKAAPSAMNPKPITVFQLRLSFRNTTEKTAKTVSVMTSWMVLSCAAE